MSAVDAALSYLHRGWSIFPCHGKKQPLVEWKDYQRRLPTEAEVRKWWSDHPDANIALITGAISGIVVVDLDSYKGDTPTLPPTGMRQTTARGGEHFFYAHPGGEVPCRTHKKTNTDVRGEGGYVIVAPSAGYVWASFKALAPCPEWVRQGRPPEAHGEASAPEEGWISRTLAEGAGEGGRNDTTARLAGYLAKTGVPEDIARSILNNWATATGAFSGSGQSRFTPRELARTIESVYSIANRAAEESKASASESPTGFSTVSLRDFMRKHSGHSIKWRVKDWLPDATILMIAAPPQGKKSWLAYDLAVSIASGTKFMGLFDTKQGPVTIVQQEDAHPQTAERLTVIAKSRLKIGQSYREGRSLFVPAVPDLPIRLHEDRALRFSDKKALRQLEAHLDEYRPALVVIDPLYYAVDQEDYMAKAINDLKLMKSWRDAYGTTFALIHHTTKSAQGFDRQSMWGSQFLNAFIESGWQVRVDPTAERVFVHRHFKAAGHQPLVRLTFDINTIEEPTHYRVALEETDEETAAESTQKSTGSLAHYVEELRKGGPMTATALATALGLNRSSVSRALAKLQTKGEVKEENNLWTAARLLKSSSTNG